VKEQARKKVFELTEKIGELEELRQLLIDVQRDRESRVLSEHDEMVCALIQSIDTPQQHKKEIVSMAEKRKVEVFTAGCPVCQGVVDIVNELACPHCDVTFYNLNQNEGVDLARAYGVTAVPAVAVDGALLDCCKRRPITKEDLQAAGIGKPR
jgi:hypothetical protein